VVSAVPGVLLLDTTSDQDHNRSVLTFAGAPAAVAEAAFVGVREAVHRINLMRHAGVHPRLGAADVIPLVPVEGTTLEQCAALAHTLGERIWKELGVPVYFYEAAACDRSVNGWRMFASWRLRGLPRTSERGGIRRPGQRRRGAEIPHRVEYQFADG